METKKRGRGRPRKTETSVVKPKGKRGRPRKKDVVEFYDISTGQMTTLEKEVVQSVSKEAFENHLTPSPNFTFTISDGNEKRRAYMETKGNTELGMRKVQEYYLTNKSFREFINAIINGAIQVKALRVAEELDSIV